jgi:hypothetical protein
MKTRAALLVLLALILCTAGAFAAGSAPSPASTAVQTAPAVASAPAADRADFLASLSGSQSTAPNGLNPAPVFMSGCTSSAQCPAGQICCLACGYADCDRHACFATKTCPHFP